MFQRLGVSLEDGPGFSQVEKIVNYPGREEPGRGEGLLGLRMADSSQEGSGEKISEGFSLSDGQALQGPEQEDL